MLQEREKMMTEEYPIVSYKNFDIFIKNSEFYETDDGDDGQTFDVMFRNRDTGVEYWDTGYDHPYEMEVVEEHIYPQIDEMTE